MEDRFFPTNFDGFYNIFDARADVSTKTDSMWWMFMLDYKWYINKLNKMILTRFLILYTG